jgi:hypothetical protein
MFLAASIKLAPREAASKAIALPIPDEAPVIITTFFFKFSMTFFLLILSN